jgi:hypothetical protein
MHSRWDAVGTILGLYPITAWASYTAKFRCGTNWLNTARSIQISPARQPTYRAILLACCSIYVRLPRAPTPGVGQLYCSTRSAG